MALSRNHAFATTAARLAYTFVANDKRAVVQDMETGNYYMVVAEGSGAACMVNMTLPNIITYPISLYSFREVSSGGDVSNVAGIGGVLASDTTPIMRGDAAESAEIAWATGNVDPISVQLSLTSDEIDDTRDVTLELDVYSGTSDAATFAVETSWNGGTLVVDSASDAATKSATRHTISATIAAADVPTSVRHVTIELTPGTHGSDVVCLVGARLKAYRK
jgi:hypothetical protein